MRRIRAMLTPETRLRRTPWHPLNHHRRPESFQRAVATLMAIRCHCPESVLWWMPIELMFEVFQLMVSGFE